MLNKILEKGTLKYVFCDLAIVELPGGSHMVINRNANRILEIGTYDECRIRLTKEIGKILGVATCSSSY